MEIKRGPEVMFYNGAFYVNRLFRINPFLIEIIPIINKMFIAEIIDNGFYIV